MKRWICTLLIWAILALPGCGQGKGAGIDGHTTPEATTYHSATPAEDCYLCGNGAEDLIPLSWGQDNVALFSLNTFEIRPLEINRYDRLDGHLIEEAAGVLSFGGSKGRDGGFSTSLLLDCDRGYATGSVEFLGDETLDIDKAASFLCEDCLNKILPQKISQCFGVGAIHLQTKEVCMFEQHLGGFGLGDFRFDCNLRQCGRSNSHQMDLLVFYCPMRYDEET